MHKNIIFDCGNVLYTWDPIYVCKKFTDNDSDAELIKSVVLSKDWGPMMDAGLTTDEEYFNYIKNKLPERLHKNAKDLMSKWQLYFPPIKEMEEILNKLSKKHDLYLLSNMSHNFSEDPSLFIYSKYFKGLVYSCDCKLIKPNKEIYQYILTKYALEPNECLFVDDLFVNVQGAESCGIDGYVFDYKRIEKFIEFLKNNNDL